MGKSKKNDIQIMTADQLEGRRASNEPMTADQLESLSSRRNNTQRTPQWKRPRTQLPNNQQPFPTVETHPFVYQPSQINTQWTPSRPTDDTARNPFQHTETGRWNSFLTGTLGAASMADTYTGKAPELGLSDLEQIKAQTEKRYNDLMKQQVYGYVDPEITRQSDELKRQIDELQARIDEMAEKNNAWLNQINPVAEEEIRSEDLFPSAKVGGSSIPEEEIDQRYLDYLNGKNKNQPGFVTEDVEDEDLLQRLEGKLPNNPYGMIEPGNIDLDNRKVVYNADGSISTERSFSTNIDGVEVLLPTVIDGKIVSEKEAIDHYMKTGEHLGIFDTPENANKYAEQLHIRQGNKYGKYLNPDIAAAAEEEPQMEPLTIDPVKPMDPVTEKEMEIEALRTEYDKLQAQHQALYRNRQTDEMLQTEDRMYDIQAELEQKEKELEKLQRDQKLQEREIYQDIMAQGAGSVDENGKVTIKDERPISIHELYEYYTPPEQRGDMAKRLQGKDTYQAWLQQNYMTPFNDIGKEELWKRIKDSSGKNIELAKDAILGAYNESDPEFTNPVYQQMIDRVPELVQNPVRTVENDEKLFNAMFTGIGSYEDLKDDQDIREKLDQYWDILTNGTAQKLQKLETIRDEAESVYGYESANYRTAENELKKIETEKDKLADYYGLMEMDTGDASPEFNSTYDRGVTMPQVLLDEVSTRTQTNDIHRIYSFVGGGKEFETWVETFSENGDPRIMPDYAYTMLLLPEEIEEFKKRYNMDMDAGREPTQAKAFLDGMQPYLRARYSDAEKIDFAENARKYPILASIESLWMSLLAPAADVYRHAAHVAGDKNMEDPESGIYYGQKFSETTQATIAKDLTENFGKAVGEGYTHFMQSTSNFLRAVAGPKGSGLKNFAMSMSQFFLQVDQEATQRYLDAGYEYNEAAARGAVDGILEVAEETLPFESMLESKGKGIGISMLLQAANEFLQEFTGATLGEKFKGFIFGDEEQARADEIIAKQGYINDNGEWVDLSQLGKKDLLEFAKLKANKEFWDQAWTQGVGGAIGGWLGGTYGATTRTINTFMTGKKINIPTNNFEGKTGSDLLVDTALGMKGTESERLARDIDEKRKQKKQVTNFDAGRLAATMAEETNEQIGQVAGDTLKNRIKKQLTDAGVAADKADELAEVMAKGLMNNGKIGPFDRHKIAKEGAAVALWGSYTSNRGMNTQMMGAQAEISEATKEQQSVAQVLRDVTGEGPAEATSSVADEVNISNKKGSAEAAVEDLSVRRPDLITPEYAEAAKAEAGNSKNNPKTFLDDAVKIRLAAFGLNTMQKTGMDQESAQRLWDAAKAEFNAAEAQRIKAQQKLNPGNGAVDYEGAALGTKEFKKKISGLSRSMRRQVLATAWIAKTLGHTVHFEYNDKVTKDENGREIRNESYIHGWESGGDGSVTINVAGALVSGRSKNMLATLPHEFTHWLEQNSKEGYAQLRQFIVDNLRAKGMNVEARMVQIMENENSILGPDSKKQQTLNGAMAEIVAQGCEAIFESPEMLSRLANEKPTVYAKFRAFLQKLMDELTTGMDESLSEEARLLRDVKDEIAKRWLSARDEALGREAAPAGSTAAALQQDLEAFDGTETAYGDHQSFSVLVKDKKTLDFLNNQKHYTTYRSMQLIDGKLYPPMAAVVAGKMEESSQLGKWEEAVEHPELIKLNDKGKPQFVLNKGQGKGSLAAAYNPYMHSSNLMINDQFSGAYDRPNLVTVECRVPVSEAGGEYKAEYAKDSTGWHSWHTGPVAGKLRNEKGTERKVFLSRWLMPVRIVSDAEVAQHYKDLLDGTDIAVPDNVVSPGLLMELKKAGVKIQESGRVQDAEDDTRFSVAQLSDGTVIAIEDENILEKIPEGKTTYEFIGEYLRKHINDRAIVAATTDVVYLGSQLPGEYLASDYSKQLLKGNRKKLVIKSRAAGLLLDMITASTEKRGPFAPVHRNKHAARGVYKYTTKFAFPVKNSAGKIVDYNAYKAQMIVNHAGTGKLNLYDVIDIEKDNQAGMRLKEESAHGTLKTIRHQSVANKNVPQNRKDNKSYSVAQLDRDYMKAVDSGNMDEAQRMVDQAAEEAMPDSKIRGKDGKLLKVYHNTNAEFNVFRPDLKGGQTGIAEGYGIYLTDDANTAENYGGKQIAAYVNITRPAYDNKRTLTKREMINLIRASAEYQADSMAIELEEMGDMPGSREDLLRDSWISNWINTYNYSSLERAYADVADNIMRYNDNDQALVQEIMASMGIREYFLAMDFYKHVLTPTTGIDGIWAVWENQDKGMKANVFLAFESSQIKRADAVTRNDDGEVIPVSQRFDLGNQDIRYSVAQLAQANGMRFDEDTITMYDKNGNVITGVGNNRVTVEMIENTPIGMLINMARDGVTTKGGKVKFKPTISAKTAAAQKKMFADLMNMAARYKDSNLVWEIAGSTLYSALKKNSDPQYSTTVDFGTVCAKTQEIINVMSRVMLEKGRGLTREEVLDVYNQTANAGLTVPCPVCYVFSRWMGVPSLLNQMSKYQKRFVVMKKDGSIDAKATQKKVDAYIREAMDEYGDKATLDKAKTSIMNRMKTQETNRSENLAIWNSKTASAEEKAEAKKKHDAAIQALDELQEELGKVEAYNWVTQALCKETSKNSGKYVVDPAFELTPDSVLFDLRRTGEFAKYAKNWRYRNTRGAGMGKAIMPYSGMSIGDIIFGTERKSDIKNPFLTGKAGAASNGIKNAITRAKQQNLIGGQRLQSTSDYRPEWGLDYIMTFLELQAIGSKVQMYTKVAEAVDLLASMQADVNLSIMGKGNGYHIATEAEIRESRTNAELRSRMGRTYDEEGNMQTYVLDFSDVTGMEYNTAKALTKKHHNVQMILVGMNDIHIRLAMANPDIDFIIPWHSSGNSQDALKSMIASAGEQLETSHNYEDSQTDTPREDQTAEQKKLWELRLKIIQGKVTAEDRKAIEKDDILQRLYERFYVEGVDPDCYQVQLGAEQAKQIFPYEYWDKSLKKAEADGNGRRFIEYCEHFGIRPRFFQFADQKGYWKVLIDRKMYDNDGNYREQQVVDVTKAKIGHLDKGGKLQDSDMPLQTSAMYGDKYSEQEKNAVDNTIAVLDEKARIQAIGTNVTEEEDEAPAPRMNQSAFGASAGVAAMDTTATSEQEVFAPSKRRARYADSDDISLSVMQPGMDVRQFMMGLNEASLSSFQEKAMLRQFKEMNMAREIANERLRKNKAELAKLEAKENPSAFDREEMRKARNRIKDAEEKLEKAELAMDRATRDKGFAELMHKNERLMKGLVGGRTIDEVQKVVEFLMGQVNDLTKEMEKRQRSIDSMRKELTQRKREALVNENSARRMAGIIRKEYASDMDTGELVQALTTIRLKIQAKEKIDQDVEDLAWRIAQGTRGEESAVINALRGTTIVLGPSQMAELKGQHRTIRDVRSDLAGTGIKVTTGNSGTLDSVWKQICGVVSYLNPDENSGNQLDALLDAVKAERKAQSNAEMFKGRNMDNVIDDLKAMIAAVEMNVPKDPAAEEIINRMNKLMNEMEAGQEESAEELKKARKQLAEFVDAGNMVLNATDALQRDIRASIDYNNALAEQSEAALWKNEKFKIIQQLKDKNTEALIKEQQKWRDRIARDKTVREKMNENMHIRKQIHTNITRLKKLIINETDLENVPEYMKSLAREVLDLIVANDLGAQKITGIAREDLKEMQRVLGIMDARDGRFTEDDLRVLNDEEVQSVIMDALADIEDGITLYNSSTKGRGLMENLDMFHTALESVLDGVTKIKRIIDKEREISIGDRQILVADAAGAVAMDAKGSRFKGELKGRGSKQLNAIRRAVVYGNLTPVYFFKQLKNRGMDMQWDELRRAENRNGLELQKAAAKIAEIAEKYHYKDWADQKTTVSVNGQTIEITMQQIMSLYAIYRREQTLNPEESEHLKGGGVYFEEPTANTDGKLRREKWQSKPVKMNDEMVRALAGKLSKDQMGYLEEIVGYLSNDMSALGNEASMRMYGIEKYKESWYFPMMIWDGVKSARSDKGISGTTENRAAHRGWSKRRKHQAVNALVIKNFTDVAVGHIVEMINYNTVAPAIENINKILNYQFKEPGDETGTVRRNTRIIFQQAYGRDALNYLETFMKDLNGGTVQDQRKTLREAALSMFKKNAVAGSLSVALQQPLSYIRAAMMISPTALAQALSPEYWKGSYAEMMKYSGVAVIKNMGRFDMNFGRSARDFIAPEKNETILAKATDKLTAAPEAMDRMTWTRMWSACKIEEHRKDPGADMQSEEFLKKVAERFNDVMQQTQVYDSVMVKSQNMRSDKFTMKMLTSFMAEPTLSLNVLADAVQNFNTKGGKAIAGKAAATFLLSAIMQALVKGLMGSGRTPDDKKTMEENFLYKWYSAFLNEANPLSLIPGYSDIVELIKNGELNDDAMGAIGKIFTTLDTAAKAIGGNGKGWYRDIEDTAGQLAQLFTNVPVKNLMRDGRAMYNFITQEPYAKRESSGAVKRQQAKAAFWSADSLIGAINTKLGEAGFRTTNKAYYSRLYDAMQSGNEQEAADIREYLIMGKGVEEKTIDSGVRSIAKADAGLIAAMDANNAAEIGKAIELMMKYGTEAKTIKSQITTEYKNRFISGSAEERRRIRDAIQKAYKKLGLTAEDANKVIDKWK